MAERWLPVVGYEGVYEVSDLGRVRSYARGAPRILRPGAHRSGHLCVLLYDGSGLAGRRTCRVHALVAAAFLGPRPPGTEIRHLNGDPDDNRFENLVYGSRGDNNRDRKWHGAAFKLNPWQIQEIKNLLGRYLQKDIALGFGVVRETISKIKCGRLHTDVDA